MIKIKEYDKNLDSGVKEAVIKDDTIIPGLSGKKIDINESYKILKKYGKFDESLLVYTDKMPITLLKNNLNKYIISGNKSKQMVSLIFTVGENDNIDNILRILEENSINATFFIDVKWLDKNNDLAFDLIKKGHTIGNSSDSFDYKNSSFIWMNTIINNVLKQKENYCYFKDFNKEYLDICTLAKSYSIMPNIIANTNPYETIKTNLTSGSFISLKTDNETLKQLQVIINYIKSKGYKIVSLKEHLKE